MRNTGRIRLRAGGRGALRAEQIVARRYSSHVIEYGIHQVRCRWIRTVFQFRHGAVLKANHVSVQREIINFFFFTVFFTIANNRGRVSRDPSRENQVMRIDGFSIRKVV